MNIILGIILFCSAPAPIGIASILVGKRLRLITRLRILLNKERKVRAEAAMQTCSDIEWFYHERNARAAESRIKVLKRSIA